MIPERGCAVTVRGVLEEYVDATYRGDVEALRKLFHPQASIAGYLGDQFYAGTPEPFFRDLRSRTSMAKSGTPYKAEISQVLVARRVASAKIEETGFLGSVGFVNYLHLVNVDGSWKIINRTYMSL